MSITYNSTFADILKLSFMIKLVEVNQIVCFNLALVCI